MRKKLVSCLLVAASAGAASLESMAHQLRALYDQQMVAVQLLADKTETESADIAGDIGGVSNAEVADIAGDIGGVSNAEVVDEAPNAGFDTTPAEVAGEMDYLNTRGFDTAADDGVGEPGVPSTEGFDSAAAPFDPSETDPTQKTTTTDDDAPPRPEEIWCDVNHCSGHGSCHSAGTDIRCECEKGYWGDLCESGCATMTNCEDCVNVRRPGAGRRAPWKHRALLTDEFVDFGSERQLEDWSGGGGGRRRRGGKSPRSRALCGWRDGACVSLDLDVSAATTCDAGGGAGLGGGGFDLGGGGAPAAETPFEEDVGLGGGGFGAPAAEPPPEDGSQEAAQQDGGGSWPPPDFSSSSEGSSQDGQYERQPDSPVAKGDDDNAMLPSDEGGAPAQMDIWARARKGVEAPPETDPQTVPLVAVAVLAFGVVFALIALCSCLRWSDAPRHDNIPTMEPKADLESPLRPPQVDASAPSSASTSPSASGRPSSTSHVIISHSPRKTLLC